MEIKQISPILALELILNNHYSKMMPRLTKYYLGAFIDNKLVGAMTLGHGTRPVHTIRRLFPSLSTKDYFEIGRMAMLEEMPKNTESQFLSLVIKWIKHNEHTKKILFTWADGIVGKPGYMYQASNFLYGSYVWSDTYISPKGERVHPRTTGGTDMEKISSSKFSRPSKEYLKENGWKHYRGKLFRYVYFLCDRKEKKKLLKESLIEWNIDYPKHCDLEWKLYDYNNKKWDIVYNIDYDSNVISDLNKTAVKNRLKIEEMKKSQQFFG
jgi:hypothetical protein